jgi:hypothetical protein
MNQILKFENTKQQITIDKDTCDDIRVADINFQSQKSNIINLLETHAMNLKDTLTQTVLFVSLLKRVTEAMQELDFLKQNMLKTYVEDAGRVPDGSVVTDWKLDYTTGILDITFAKDVKQVERTEVIDKELCGKIKKTQIAYNAITDIVSTIIEKHSMDAKDTIINNPTFSGFNDLQARALTEFMNVKSDMMNSYLTDEERACNVTWNLSFDDCKLTVYK